MKRDAAVATEDLASTLDYLEGLAVILDRLDERGEGKDSPSPLLTALQGIDSTDMAWEPLRYQSGVGQG